ncbi:hypothetical protein MIND_01225400 [Mycena indigotica]|uniref:ATP-dependent RNA helicase n=1 Tax=Mycena indigotica TaxID=2126181 RepID=A0A8H6S3Z4_9AGAR|nr:uncharacterized protein MIND_01225400 [Mycena indigotica]KAF7291997.1 hypothetical protein MIND_01225400 [Mycena indigotica]
MLAARLRWAAPPRFASLFFRHYAAQAAAAAPAREAPPQIHFNTLKGKVSQQTLDAILVVPFNLTTMSPVQSEVLPLLPQIAEPYQERQDGEPAPLRDLMVRAKTGTGKTLGFLVPAIEARVKALEVLGGVRYARSNVGALIISPTRELATQIAAEALKLTHHHKGFEVQLFTGGNSKRMQMRNWMRGRKDIVVATPGRLRDLLETEPEVKNAFANTATFILDEADTLLDMGFREDIEGIKAFLPPTPQRQTFLFSATISKEIQQVARSLMDKKYEYIDCISDETAPVHAHVEQFHTVVPSAADQLPHIMRLIMHDQLVHPTSSKVIVFLPTTKMTQLFSTLVTTLAANNLPNQRATRIFELHSKRAQETRTSVSNAFRSNNGPAVLITSDVSARGVDYPGVTRVIQVGIPAGREHYIHRVGRTGRAGSKGRGDLVLLPWEIGFVTWQLTDVPMKPLALNEMKDTVRELAAKHDANPKEFFAEHETRPGRPPFPPTVVPMTEDLDENVKQLLPRLDGGAIRETFLSLLGYYMPKSHELRVEKTVIVQGCEDWTVEACGLETPPFISVDFLQKLGLNDGRTRHFGKRRQESAWDKSQRAGPAWMGRGNVRANRENRDRPTIMHHESKVVDTSEDSEAAEYRAKRYQHDSRGSYRPRASRQDENTRTYDRTRAYDRGTRPAGSGFDSGERRDGFNGREGGNYGSRGSYRGHGGGYGRQSNEGYRPRPRDGGYQRDGGGRGPRRSFGIESDRE